MVGTVKQIQLLEQQQRVVKNIYSFQLVANDGLNRWTQTVNEPTLVTKIQHLIIEEQQKKINQLLDEQSQILDVRMREELSDNRRGY